MTVTPVSPREMVELLTAAVVVAFFWVNLSRRRWNLPPGPKRLPLVGNVFHVSRGYEWLQYACWGKEYGPVLYLSFLGERVFLLNSRQAAADILERNMNVYSDRPRNMVMASELIGWNRAVALNPGGAQHRKFRRLLNKSLNSTAVHDYRLLQEQSAQTLVRLLLNSPQDFLKHTRTTVGKSVIDISYGHDVKVKDQDYIDYAEDVHEVFGVAAKPYAFLVDLIPFLRHLPSWLPGLAFKTQALQWRRDLDELARIPFNTVKADIANGDAPDSYVASQLRALKAKPAADARENDIMWTAASLYTGGSDTTIAGLTAFVLMMCLHPHAQKRAQQEIDKVVGNDRLPGFADMANLPYVGACVKETLRYWTVAPLGLPHRTMEDGRYQDYDVPTGSTIIANVWGIMHDEAVYSDPLTFNPERFLPTSAGGLGEPDCAPAVFGYGRRICPGMHLAEASLWVYAARMLAVLDIKPVCGEDGKEVPPRAESSGGVINIPMPFVCDIRPRSPSASAVLAGQ